MKPAVEHSSSRYVSYIIGLVLSIITTLVAYFLVVYEILPKQALIYSVLGVAIVQLVVQLVFFLHLGRGQRWKLVTFIFALLVIVIVVVGSLWIMANLDYNMMQMSPEQMEDYMKANEGI